MIVEKYVKKPVVIEAVQFDGHNGWQIEDWSNKEAYQSPVLEPTEDNPTGAYMQVKTLEGIMTGGVGCFIIKGVKGEFCPCKPDIFEATYERIRGLK